MARRGNEMSNQECKKMMGMVQSEGAAPQTGAPAPERQKIAEK
jgi:hypothetical protein